MLSRCVCALMWFVVLLVAVCTDLQAVKNTALNRITVNVSDVDIDFFMLLLGFDELLGQGFFGAARRIEGRSAKSGGISRHSTTILQRIVSLRSFPDKDTAGGVVAVVACVDSNALEAGNIIQEWEQSAELR